MTTLRSKVKNAVKTWLLPPGVWVWASGLFRQDKKRPAGAYAHLLEQNRLLRDKHKGERCFIFATGSSIAQQDLKKLVGENVIAVSSAFVHPDYALIKPKYHVLPHILYGHSEFHSEEKFAGWLREMEKGTPDAEMFFHIGDKEFIERNSLFHGRTIHWNEYVPWDGECGFELDMARVPGIWSVSEYAIFVAMYLGFENIYLIGFDHDWFNGPLVHFYPEDNPNILSPAKEQMEFVDSEFQMRRHADIFKKYKCYYQMKRNIYNANANLNSYVDVFPMVDFDSLFE